MNSTAAEFGGYLGFYTTGSGSGGGSNGYERMRIDQNGNVGIGVTNPTAKLHIGGTAGVDGIRFPDGSLMTSSSLGSAGIITNAGNTLIQADSDNVDGGDIIMQTGPTTRMTVTNAGNVGIGTTSPGYKLQVAGDIHANGGWLRTSGNEGWHNDTHGGGWHMSDGTWIRAYGSKQVYINSFLRADGGIASGSVVSDGPGTIRATGDMRTDGNLRVQGVLTCLQGTCPTGNVMRMTPNLHLNSPAANAVIINWDNGAAATDSVFRVGNGASVDVMVVKASGRVGIGMTPAPSDTLFTVNGLASNTSGVWAVFSDRRLKKDISPINDALATLTKLQGVSFNWKDPKKDAEMGRVRGLIAQDVEKVVPEWVRTNEEGYKSIQTIGMDAMLIEAIKQQQKQIEDLEMRLKKLEPKGTDPR